MKSSILGGLTRAKHCKVIWSLSDQPEGKSLTAQMTQIWDEAESTVEELLKGPPIPPTCKAFIEGNFIRPTSHRRAYYLRLAADQGCLAFKGTEPMAHDFDLEVAEIESSRSPLRYSPMNSFVIKEYKIGLGVSVPEATNQAQIGYQFQTEFFKRHRHLAQTPLPLLVFQMPSEFETRVQNAVGKFLAPLGQDIHERLTQTGLGVVVYFYHGFPLRAAHMGEHGKSGVARSMATGVARKKSQVSNYEKRVAALTKIRDPFASIEGWIGLLIEMLMLGYFPFDTYYMGHCLQPQNLCLDGGTVDIDSIVPMAKIEDGYFFELFAQMMSHFSQSIGNFLTGTQLRRESSECAEVVTAFIWGEVLEGLARRIESGEPCDPRLKMFFAEQGRGPGSGKMHRILREILKSGT